MASKLYALLVGINDYPPAVGSLSGCLNDVDNFHAYLQRNFPAANLAVQMLKDGDATRENVVTQFRTHLGRARDGDIAVFLYCGHGARWASAPAFKGVFPDGMDEGLVCIDSRRPGGFDLADKELAILIAEVARHAVHVAMLLDCCHSGSGTRGLDAFRGLKARMTHAVATERPLDSYLRPLADSGFLSYADMAAMHRISIPQSQHILLSACERMQLAQETEDHRGVFTTTLIDVLDAAGTSLSYSDLFLRCRSRVLALADNQKPQFETVGNFDSSGGFLGRSLARTGRRYRAYFAGDIWKLECGAIGGMPMDSNRPVTLALYAQNAEETLAGTARTVRIGAHDSDLQLDFTGDTAAAYRAQVTSLPVAPLPIYFSGDASAAAGLQARLDGEGGIGAALTDSETTRYALQVEGGRLQFKDRAADRLIQWAPWDAQKPQDALRALTPVLKQVATWERCLALANPRTHMDTTLVDFGYTEKLHDGSEHVYPSGDITLDYVKRGGEWRNILGRITVRNRTPQPLNALLVYFSEAFGIVVLCNEPILPGQVATTLWGDNADADYFWLQDDSLNQSLERFKLIVSTEKADDFLLDQPDVDLGSMAVGHRALGNTRPKKILLHQREWFTQDLRITLKRRLDRAGTHDVAVAAGKIIIKGHPCIKANISLGAADLKSRGAGSSDFYQAFERQGLRMVNFSTTRGAAENTLELTAIENAQDLATTPLEIELTEPLQEGEMIVPVSFDGQHALLGGQPWQDEAGVTHIHIEHLPEATDQRRSLGGSLKLYFFKTYLKMANVNRLRWVDYRPDGSFQYQSAMLDNKVSAARSILLLIHGIIGDTQNMADGVRACGLEQRFDLVLTYDYENLTTPIAATAQVLKAQLAALGLQENDDKKLTLLVHSMGGLVSRWFIEREGGNRVVDHLVMCGTPNHGSPFGAIEGARKILSALTCLSLNYLPALIPFSSGVLMALNRSRKLTPTLEQMKPGSEFIATLNGSADPGVRYSILAGDVNAYHESADPFFGRLLAKVGRSVLLEALFEMKPNDIAVGVDSIREVGEWASIPTRTDVACHHLNYFTSNAGQQALKSVHW